MRVEVGVRIDTCSSLSMSYDAEAPFQEVSTLEFRAKPGRWSSLQRSVDPQNRTGRSQGFFCGVALSDEYIGLLGFEACRFVFGIDSFYQGNEVLNPQGRDALL